MSEISRYVLLGTFVGCGGATAPESVVHTTGDSPPSTGTRMTSEPGNPSSTSDTPEAMPDGSTAESPGLAPVILSGEVPAEVSAAGPVVFTTTTRNTSAARARLDGFDLSDMIDEGAGVFSGVAAFFGAVDNGVHVLEVVAEGDGQVDERAVAFQVDAPPPGTLAWEVTGPVGSRARRLALTESGDVLELGTQEVEGVPLPTLRKRSGSHGAQLWERPLDFREGTAEDILVTPGGDLWVAMNVRINADHWRPRILRLRADGTFTGVEVPTESGQTVRALDGDGAGGCLAVGFAGVAGSSDVIAWRMTGANTLQLVKTWDYLPPGEEPPQPFSDIASAVVVDDGVAWIVGTSHGPHDGGPHSPRGLVVRMEINTGEVLGPTVVAPVSDEWPHSMFFGAARHPMGVLVTGTACDAACTTQRVETALFTASGARLWWRPETSAMTAVGHAIAEGHAGRVYVAATVHDGDALRGLLLARDVYEVAVQPFTLALSAAEVTDVAVGLHGQIFGVGRGASDGRVFHAHP